MTVLAIDVGNTRIKWGFRHRDVWLSLGALPKADAGKLVALWSDHPAPSQVIGCNVAGPESMREIELAVASRGSQVEWVTSRPEQCGVINCYDEPNKLGVDRWIALIAAHNHPELQDCACVVLSAGTAVTIDVLTADGEFRGGVIIPSPMVMADALEKNTAALRRQPGKFHLLPTNTADAIATGAYIAVGGALARVERALHDMGATQCEVILTGGGAADLQPTLERPVKLIPNLVLEGLIFVAAQHD